MLVGLVSAKGSPGVTTTAVALAAVGGHERSGLFVELDPSGGDVECLAERPNEAGLLRIVSELRRRADPNAVRDSVVEAPRGVRAILAPTSEPLAASTVAAAIPRLAVVLGALSETVVVDAGRWSRTQPSARRLDGCSVVGVVCHPSVAGVEHARGLIDPLRQAGYSNLAVVLVGDRPYRHSEVARVFDVPVAGVIAWDPRGVNALMTGGPSKSWSRTLLARSSQAVMNALTSISVERVDA